MGNRALGFAGKHPRAASDTHGPAPHPFQMLNVHDCPRQLPFLETEDLQVQSLSHLPGAAALIQAQRAPHGPGPPQGGLVQAGAAGCDAMWASTSPSPDSRKIPIDDPPSWAGKGSASKEQGNYHARGLSPITPDPSVALKVPPGPGPLAKADAFEERAPHFTPHCTLSPQTCPPLASSW